MISLTPNSSFSLTISIELPNRPGTLAGVTQAIAQVGGNLEEISLVARNLKVCVRKLTVDAYSCEHGQSIVEAVTALPEVKVLEVLDNTFDLHKGGKIEIQSRRKLKSQSDLAMVYTPGVGRVCQVIASSPEKVFSLTMKSNTIAIVTDGSAVLGLGNLGPEAA
ncbi:MAG: NAD-dependent malic enzyme, partial [Prochloron sp. SP5CPC1]|nr:NAD-dependent malic enzyme [Candidatus Paraprochloron terpiosi SP5CPC1]